MPWLMFASSSYSEDISVMLARLETLLNVEVRFSNKMGRLASKILHTLQEMALKVCRVLG